jgi:hypothetical protein
MTAPSRNIALFGTNEEVAPPRVLRAGKLSVELEAGNLRYIRWDNEEVLRAVSFIVRDKDWGTYNPIISDIEVEENEDNFLVTYTARTADDDQAFSYRAQIEGAADGTLIFSGNGSAETDFLTNRTGFVILHPIEGVAGEPVEITHTDGKVVEGRFPEIIDPLQPMMDLRKLVHTSPRGLKVTCLMEGDTYEMEDQRNWTDASYKTYVRPLALPWPYTLKPSDSLKQKITVSISGNAKAVSDGEAVSVEIGSAAGEVPELGLGISPENVGAALEQAEVASKMNIAHLICHYDPRKGHDATTLKSQVDLARRLGAEPWLEAVIVSVDGFEDEIKTLGQTVADIGAPFETIMVSPAPDLKCTLPGSVWPETPPAEELYDATRKAFPGKRIGGGMFSYFTELNRKRPPTNKLDLITFTTSSLVHAGDDRSVTEAIQALPAIAKSALAIASGKPLSVGPSAMGMRDNPYGEAPKQNPQNIRQAMNWNDPRQRGLLGAAWNLSYFARMAYGGADSVALGEPVGPHGAIYAKQGYMQPWFDENGGLYPVYHILLGMAALKRRPMLPVSISRPDLIQGLAVQSAATIEIWLANLSSEPVQVDLPLMPTGMKTIDADTFEAAAKSVDYMQSPTDSASRSLTLDAYAVARLLAKSA